MSSDPTITPVVDAPLWRRPQGEVHLVFVPGESQPRFLLWGRGAATSSLGGLGMPKRERLVGENLQPRSIEGHSIGLLDAVAVLAAMTTAEAQQSAASLAGWSMAAKMVLDLVARGRLVPRVVATGGATEARFAVALALQEDMERVMALARALPVAAYAVPLSTASGRGRRAGGVTEIWTPLALLRKFLDATADALVREATRRAGDSAGSRRPGTASSGLPWPHRLKQALKGPDATFVAQGFQERTLLDEMEAWVRPAFGAEPGAPRVCLRLELPATTAADADADIDDDFTLRFFLQAGDDPSLLIPGDEVFRGRDSTARRLRFSIRTAQELLLRALSTAARIFMPIEHALREARPDRLRLDARSAWAFISDAAPALMDAGMVVMLPAGLTPSGQRRLRMRMRVGARRPASAGSGQGGLSLDDLMSFEWQAELGGETLSAQDLHALAKLKAPLVRYRGQWVAVDPAELDQARQLLADGGGVLSGHAALSAALSESAARSDVSLPVDVEVQGQLAEVLARLRTGPEVAAVPVPATLHGTLRPYQQRGLGWLTQMADLGLGACLADDMGLGKTVQLLAFLLHQQENAPQERRAVLLVCPTSVVGNWEHEIAKFAPSLPVLQHYGVERARDASAFDSLAPWTIVLTTYGLLRRDVAALRSVRWSAVVLDEAQNIKNADSLTARAARSLPAGVRVALTGTPVENRLAELWSISEFLNPGLLGPFETFRREVALPIERYGREDVAERLTRVVRPFILRRLKSDPSIIEDLPPKHEMKVFCTLTREQASLYQAEVDEAMEGIETAEGIARRGRVLALITALKQICNHPAQYLRESAPLAARSGKLQRLCEMLEEALASGDRVLIFTQYREMGSRLVQELSRVFRTEVPFLHGGVARAARDAMVKRFQEDPRAPRLFVLSVKAGGTGLNLTAANHVFHYDRWWNPAVEDQATDRAYRIGQHRSVQVHKFLCAGTIEEKVDAMLESKRDLASRIVGAGEQWITELDNSGLRELLSLTPHAAVAADESERDDNGCVPVRRAGRKKAEVVT